MKVKELGKAIAEFELNNIPKLIKSFSVLLITLSVNIVYLAAKLATKYWYVFTLIAVVAMLDEGVIVWNEPTYHWYTNIGPIGISNQGFIVFGFIVVGYFLARKTLKKLDSIFNNKH